MIFFLREFLIFECNSLEEYGIYFLCVRSFVMNSGDGISKDHTYFSLLNFEGVALSSRETMAARPAGNRN